MRFRFSTLLMLTAALGLIAVDASGLAHRAERHAVCEHGFAIHVDGAAGTPAPRAAAAVVSDLALEASHAHCFAPPSMSSQSAAEAPLYASAAPVAGAVDAPIVEQVALRGQAILFVAPKTSPPIAG